MFTTKQTKSFHQKDGTPGRIIPEFNRENARVKPLFPNRFPAREIYQHSQVILSQSANVITEPNYMQVNHHEFVHMMNWLRKYNFKRCPKLAIKVSNCSMQLNSHQFGRARADKKSLYPRLRNLCRHLNMQITFQIARNIRGLLSFSNTNLTSLKQLYTLSTKTRQTSIQEITSLGPLVRKLANPSSLTLNFTTMEELPYEGIAFLKSKRFLALKELNISLHWKISWTRLYNSLLCYLQKHGRIRLNMEYNKAYSNPNIKVKVQQTRTGRIIDCNIQAWFDSGFSIYDICFNISSLEALRINFSGDDVYINKDFFQNVNSMQLKRLDLEFSHQFLLTMEGFNSLGKFITNNLPMLETLNLSFTRCLIISPQFSKILRHCIEDRLKTLKHLGLSFIHCQKLTDEELQNLSACFTNPLQTLKTINFTFTHCDKITDAGMRILGYSVCNPLDSLQALVLRIKECGRITSSGMDELQYCVKNCLREIRSLNIDFKKSTDIISEELFWEPETGELFKEDEIEYDYPDFSEVKSYMHDYDLEEFSNYDYGSDPDDAAYQYYSEYDHENYYANDEQYEHFDFRDFYDFENAVQ